MVHCKDCVYWHSFDRRNPSGECRRYAPSPMAKLHILVNLASYSDADRHRSLEAAWPLTNEYSSCGDGQPK